MKTFPDERKARTAVAEVISTVPYLVMYQGMHRRRWIAAAVLAVAAGVAWIRWRTTP
ncbi:hypothetical protein J7643_02845 [bacterium]|nr:hypothetical protein [bacterium]